MTAPAGLVNLTVPVVNPAAAIAELKSAVTFAFTATPVASTAGDLAISCGPTAAVGVTKFDAAERVPTPIALTARTRNVYAVPLVSPLTTRVRAVAGIPVMTVLSLTTIS